MGWNQGLHALLDNPRFCKLLIVASALTWGFSFVIMKDAVAAFPVFWLLAVRFCSSAVMMFVIFRRHVLASLDRETIVFGLFLGFLGWAGYAFQTVGITLTTPGKNAFLTGCYCVIVPFWAWLVGLGKPERYNVIGAFICVVGLGFVALDNGFPLNLGDVLTLGGAIFYALQMAEVSKRGPGLDVWAITMWQFVSMGVISLGCSLVLEQPPAPEVVFTPGSIVVLVFLSLICSGACIAASNHAFTKVDPTAGSLLSSLESPSGMGFSALLAGEQFTPRLVVGFALIFISIVYSEAGPAIVGALPGRRHTSRGRRTR